MVNLAAGKNSTDIALAVDAIDLVLAERPDVVVIASSDSDFAPLVHRLREKGCVVRGIGQMGKTGNETQDVYDDFTVLEHHKSAASPSAAAKPARKTARKVAVKAPAAKKMPAAKKVAVKTAATKAAPRKTTARKAAPAAVVEMPAPAPVPVPVPAPSPKPATAHAPAPAPTARPAQARGSARGGASVQSVLDCLPELAAGQGLALNVAVQRLREAQLLGKNSSSLKLFAQLSDRFDLLPADKPTQVRLRR